MSQKIRFTRRLRGAIPHLAEFLLEDTDHGLFDFEHPLYRKLKRVGDKRALRDLLQWLAQQQDASAETDAPSEPAPSPQEPS